MMKASEQSPMTRLEQKRANRFRFLNALYETTDGRRDHMISMWELGDQIGMDRETTSGAVEYLVGEHLMEYLAIGGEVGITHYGITQVERALERPTEPTQYFPPVVNITHVHGSMTNSQIQQGSAGSSQVLHVAPADLDAVRRFVTEFAQAVAASDLRGNLRAETDAEIATLNAQLQSPKPKAGIIAEGLRSLRTILEGAAGSVLGSMWLPQLLPLLAIAAQAT